MTIAELESRLVVLEGEITELRSALEKEKIREGFKISREQTARGDAVPAREFLEAMRKKHNIGIQ